MTSINLGYVLKLEANITLLIAGDLTLKAAADAFLAWRARERKKKKAREIKAGTYSRPLIPGMDYLNFLSDEEALLKILKSNPESLLEYLKRPKKNRESKKKK